MMNKSATFLCCLLFGFLLHQSAIAQNLVPNGSFEEAIECPTTLDALHDGCANWFKSIQVPGLPMNENPSPDWYHTCSEFDELSPPNLIIGYQEPYEGSGYAGFATYDDVTLNNREILGVELAAPLAIGQTYRLSFRVVRVSNSNFVFATNFGVKFTQFEVFESLGDIFEGSPSFSIDSMITDTLNWVEINYVFLAEEAHQYLHIGNFKIDSETIVAQIEDVPFPSAAYYFIDNVSVIPSIPNAIADAESFTFKTYPNPFNDKLVIESESPMHRIALYSMMGEWIRTENINYKSTYQLDLSELEKGVYILHVMDSEGNVNLKKVLKL